ncbi:hypothetical protein [Mycobacterium haemophilum]|nr:hypothetical protein [Mycobacterium haemophilum]MCV7340807.1 hypothetical protein [Mycobacterium haemophilum DSM 44634]
MIDDQGSYPLIAPKDFDASYAMLVVSITPARRISGGETPPYFVLI